MKLKKEKAVQNQLDSVDCEDPADINHDHDHDHVHDYYHDYNHDHDDEIDDRVPPLLLQVGPGTV